MNADGQHRIGIDGGKSAGAVFLWLIVFSLLSGQPAGALECPAYTLKTSPASVVFTLHCAAPLPNLRTQVLHRPRRFVAEVTMKASVPPRASLVIPLTSHSPVEKIQMTSHRDFLRLVFQLRQSKKIVYKVRRDSFVLVFSFADPEISALAGPETSLFVPTTPATRRTEKGERQDSPEASSFTLHAEPRASPLEKSHSDDGTPSSTSARTAPAALTLRLPNEPSTFAATPAQNTTPLRSGLSLPQFSRIKGFVDMRGAADTSRDNAFEHARAFRERVHLEAKIPGPSNKGNGFALVSGRSDLLWFGTRSDWKHWDLDLHEAYVQWSPGPMELRLGKQIVRWGKADQLSPVDVLNPEDLREGVTWDLEDRKIPVWMGRMRAFRGPFGLEGVLVPFFEPHDVNLFGTDWAIFGHLTSTVAADPRVPVMLKEALKSFEVHRREPSQTLKNLQWGGRLTTETHGWDLAVSTFHGFDPMVHIMRFPLENIHVNGSFSNESVENALMTGVFTGPELEVRHRRTRMIGFDFETTLKNIGLRGEAAYFSARSLLTDELTSTSFPAFFGVVGMDHAGPNDWYANLQLAYQRIGGDTDRILYFEKDNVSINGELSKRWLRGDLEARLRYLIMLTDGSSYWNPSLIYHRFRPLSFTLGLNLFAGPADTFLGHFRKNDQATVSARYDF
ncbi:MAG: DUF1302 family protein [Thermogutta sp.]